MARAEVIKWNDVDLDRSKYTMTLEPSSSFAMTPSAIRDDLETKLLNGQISLEDYHKQIRQYDPDSTIDLLAASALNLDFTQERLENGERILPDTRQDLVAGVKQMTSARLLLDMYDDVSVDIYEAFDNWIEVAQSYLTEGAEPAMETTVQPQNLPPQGMM